MLKSFNYQMTICLQILYGYGSKIPLLGYGPRRKFAKKSMLLSYVELHLRSISINRFKTSVRLFTFHVT